MGFKFFRIRIFVLAYGEVFQKKSWVVVILLFKELSLMRSHSLRIEYRRMRFSPLLRKFDVVIIPSKKDQNRPTQSWDIAWNVRSKTENPSSLPLLGMGQDLAQTVFKLVKKCNRAIWWGSSYCSHRSHRLSENYRQKKRILSWTSNHPLLKTLVVVAGYFTKNI